MIVSGGTQYMSASRGVCGRTQYVCKYRGRVVNEGQLIKLSICCVVFPSWLALIGRACAANVWSLVGRWFGGEWLLPTSAAWMIRFFGPHLSLPFHSLPRRPHPNQNWSNWIKLAQKPISVIGFRNTVRRRTWENQRRFFFFLFLVRAYFFSDLFWYCLLIHLSVLCKPYSSKPLQDHIWFPFVCYACTNCNCWKLPFCILNVISN